jgi:hypothetical protein
MEVGKAICARWERVLSVQQEACSRKRTAEAGCARGLEGQCQARKSIATFEPDRWQQRCEGETKKVQIRGRTFMA